MPAIGDKLRQARMRQKLDIADVEERTKIRAKYLRALENEEFGLLPGGTFVKTFLRTYAEVLGLDAHLLVEEFRTTYEPADELEAPALGAPPGAQRERRRLRAPGPPGRGTVLVVVLVAIVGFLLVLGLVTGDEGGGGESAGPVTETKQRPKPKRQRPRPPRRPAPGGVTLTVTPTVPTYVCLDSGAGSDVVFEGILQEPRTFKDKTLRINLGKTSAELKANGKPVQIEPSPTPVGFEFKPTGTKPLPVGRRPCAVRPPS